MLWGIKSIDVNYSVCSDIAIDTKMNLKLDDDKNS